MNERGGKRNKQLTRRRPPKMVPCSGKRTFRITHRPSILFIHAERRPSIPLILAFLLFLTFVGLSAQTDTTAAAAGLLSPLSMQNLVTLAAMTQPSLQAAAAQTPTQAALTNAATSLCKCLFRGFFYLLFWDASLGSVEPFLEIFVFCRGKFDPRRDVR